MTISVFFNNPTFTKFAILHNLFSQPFEQVIVLCMSLADTSYKP